MRCGEKRLQGTAWHLPCRLSLFPNKVSEHTEYPALVFYSTCLTFTISVKSQPVVCFHSAAPTPVNNLSAVAANSSTIFVNWSLPSFPNGPITYYNVYFREQEGHIPQAESVTDAGFQIVTTSDTVTAINLTELKPYTNYTIHVRAIIAAKSLQNVKAIPSNLTGAANIEIITRTYGDVPDNLMQLGQPTSGPTSTTIPIEIPDTRQIDTGYVM